MKGDGESFDDELDDESDALAVKGAQKMGSRVQSEDSKVIEKEDGRTVGGLHMGTSKTGKATDGNVQAHGESVKRRRRLSCFRVGERRAILT